MVCRSSLFLLSQPIRAPPKWKREKECFTSIRRGSEGQGVSASALTSVRFSSWLNVRMIWGLSLSAVPWFMGACET